MILSAIVSPKLLLVLSLIALVISIVAIVDVVRRPNWVWQASRQNKTLWLVLNIVGLLVCGLIIGLIYLLVNALGLSNLVFLIVTGVLNWALLYGFIQLVSRATTATTRRAQAPAIRAQRLAALAPRLPERSGVTIPGHT